ncbi:hypothetical protein BDY24DRAFT_438628 [Mrakia frigida]|uniref:uncharacterized protein n=1 Tax=Mrakia frigida TaxID=29902 RepID=UPI003FCC107D
MLAFSSSSILCIALLSISSTHARPYTNSRSSQTTFGTDEGGGELEEEGGGWFDALARKFAPIIYLSEDETFWPSSASFILPAFTVLNSSSSPFHPQPSILSTTNLDSLPFHGSSLHLGIASSAEDLVDRYNGQPTLDRDEVDVRIFGQPPPSKGEGEWEVIAFAVEKSKGGVIDVYYWTYYPYNLGKHVRTLGVVGNHISDWEAVMVRTVDGEAISVDYLAHTGDFGEGTVRWEDVTKEDGRPVAFSASGSHGLWSRPGSHVYASALNLFTLVDETSRGPRWDTSRRLLPLPYFKPSSSYPSDHRTREIFSGDSSWLNWRGPFGDFGQTDCWWSGIYPACQLVDGPYGPARESLKEPPRCILSKLSSSDDSKSLYSFEISSHLLPVNRTTFVGVRQLCRRFDGLPEFEGEGQGPRSRRGEEVVWGWDEISSENVTSGRFEMETSQCRRGFHVAAYGTALSHSQPSAKITKNAEDCKECSYLSELRRVCPYDEKGAVKGRSVDVRDIDVWGWQK